jgi:hypothetical protein
MIKVSFEFDRLIVGQRTQVAIHLANVGPGKCTDVAFNLRLAPGMTLMRGVTRVDIPELQDRQTHVHHVTVRPARAGNMAFTSSNFAYRDQVGILVRDNDFSWPVAVLPASQNPASPRRRLEVVSAPGRFRVGQLDELRIEVRNTTDVPFSNATVAINGPFESNGSRVKHLGELSAGASRAVSFGLRAEAEGPLTVTVRTAYSYRDERGLVFTDEQPDSLRVMIGPQDPTQSRHGDPRHTASPVRTILYLAAQPRDLPPLRTDKEFHEVKERLQLGRNRDHFRLEPPYVAARKIDVGQALVDHHPYIVHFAGHGEVDGSLYVEGDSGLSEPVDPGGLAELFGLYSRTIKCVIVNACHSVRLAAAIAEYIDYAIGMRSAIGDEASIAFSVGFYQALSSGQAIPEAFRHAKAMIRTGTATSPEHITPMLFSLR